MSGSLLLMGIQSSWKGQTPLCDMSRAAVQSVCTDTATVETWQYFCASREKQLLQNPVFPCPNAPGFLRDSAGPPDNSAIKELIFVTARKLQEHSVVTRATVHPD